MLNPNSSRPLYQQLADRLKKMILDGAYPVGSRLESEPEIAERYVVARGTVRQALDMLVGEGFLSRVQGKGTFIASIESSICVKQVGVIVPYLNDNLTVGILSGIESLLRDHEYSLLYSSSEGDLEIEKEHILRLRDMKVCGLILMPISSGNEAGVISQVLPPEVQLVVVDRVIPGWEASGVFVDNHGGAMMVVKHLVEQGFTRIGCITEKGYISAVNERMRGYEEAMRQSGLVPLASIPLKWLHMHWDGKPPVFSDDEMKPVEQIIRSSTDPVAFYCINDFIAVGVMKYLLDRNYRIPQDVALVGFDDIPLAQYLPSSLTTVVQPRLDIGREAAQLLLDLLEKPGHEPRKIILPVSLVIRDSSRLVNVIPEINQSIR